MVRKAKKKYFNKNYLQLLWERLVKSFNLSKILYSFAFDIVFWILFFLSFSGFAIIFNKFDYIFDNYGFIAIFIVFISLTSALFLYNMALLAFFKGKIWAKILDKKYLYSDFKSLLIMNLIFYTPVIILMLIISSLKIIGINPSNAYIFFILVIGHFNLSTFYNYFIGGSVRDGLFDGFINGFSKIHLLIIPYIILGGVFIIVNFIFKYFNEILNHNILLSFIFALVIATALLSFFRIFFALNLEDV